MLFLNFLSNYIQYTLSLGRDILRNGTAVDAAVATAFCLGLYSMHSTGIGGGGLMMVYSKDANTFQSFDFREVAPGKSKADMFKEDPSKSNTGKYSCHSCLQQQLHFKNIHQLEMRQPVYCVRILNSPNI